MRSIFIDVSYDLFKRFVEGDCFGAAIGGGGGGRDRLDEGGEGVCDGEGYKGDAASCSEFLCCCLLFDLAEFVAHDEERRRAGLLRVPKGRENFIRRISI